MSETGAVPHGETQGGVEYSEAVQGGVEYNGVMGHGWD